MLGLLYDVHGNLDALEAVLAEAERAGVDRWLLGGDYAAFGPRPAETLARLRELRDATWLRGNTERWLVDPPAGADQLIAGLAGTIAALPAGEVDRLIGLPAFAELDGVLYCHASPLSDMASFDAQLGDEDERLLAGVRDQEVVFGHTHVQFRRPGANGTQLLNPGSVGMPTDGDQRAAWAIRHADGEWELRRTEYDPLPAIARMRELDWGERYARRLETASP